VVARDVDPADDPEVVHLQPNAHVQRTSDRSDDSEAQRRISPRRRKQQREKVELVSLRVPFNNCESSVAETLWLRILSHLLPRDLCAAALVSKEMKRLTDDDDLWSYFALSRHGYTTKPEPRGWKEVYGMRNKCAAHYVLHPILLMCCSGLWRRIASGLAARTLLLLMEG